MWETEMLQLEPTTFTVDRSKTAQATIYELIDEGWNFYGDLSLLVTAPVADHVEVRLDFFRAGGDEDYIPAETLQQHYVERKSGPDVQAFVQYVQSNPDVADVRPVGMQWHDVEGRYCYVAFDCLRYVWHVNVHRLTGDWRGVCMFAGCRKSLGL